MKKAVDFANYCFHWSMYQSEFYENHINLLSRYCGVVLCDENSFSIRKEKVKEYKANRKECSVEQQLYRDNAHRFMQDLRMRFYGNPHFNILSYEGLEGDDLLALLHYHYGYSIEANDKDLLQVSNTVTKLDGTPLMLRGMPKTLTELKPNMDTLDYLLYLCLFGDKSDNIPRLLDKGKKAIEKAVHDIFLKNNPFKTAHKIFGELFEKNLWLTLLPNPSIIYYDDIYELLEALDNRLWGKYVRENTYTEVLEYIEQNI